MNNYGLARRYPGSGNELEPATQKELVHVTNRIASIGDIGRVALDEMTTTYVTAEQLVAQALVAAHCMSRDVPQTEVSQAYHQALTQHLLQRIVTATNLTNDQIIRYLHTSQRG